MTRRPQGRRRATGHADWCGAPSRWQPRNADADVAEAHRHHRKLPAPDDPTMSQLGHFRKSPQFCTEPALTQRTDIPGPELHVRKVLHCSRNALKVEFQFRQCATLPIRSLSQQRPALTGLKAAVCLYNDAIARYRRTFSRTDSRFMAELCLHPTGRGNVSQNDFRIVSANLKPVEWFANCCGSLDRQVKH
jgi:hypothetical protein